MFAIQRSYLLTRILLEDFLRRDTLPGRGPHVSDVKILDSVIVIIEPADSHARAHILNPGLRSDVGKSSVAVVVAPPAAKTVAGVVFVEARLRRDIAEGPVPIVAHHEVRRTILSIM